MYGCTKVGKCLNSDQFCLCLASRLHLRESEFDWQIICKYGWIKLDEICDKVCSGSITIVELRSINARRAEMSKACVAATHPSIKKSWKNRHSKTAPSGIPSFSIVQDNVDKRLKEFEYFIHYRDQLFNFLKLTEELQLTGI